MLPEVRVVWARRWDRLWSLWLTVVFILLPIAAWVQHILSSAASERWVALVLGAIIFPIGMLHGIAIWFGFLP